MKDSRVIQSAFSLDEQSQQGSRFNEDSRLALASRGQDSRENKRYLKIQNNKNQQKAQRFYLPIQTLAAQNNQQPSLSQTSQPSMMNFSQINSDRAARETRFDNSEANIPKYQSMQFKMINLSEVRFADASKSIDSNTHESLKQNSSIDKEFITDSNFHSSNDVRLAHYPSGERRNQRFKQISQKGNFESLINAGAAIRQPIIPGNRSGLMNFRASSISRVIQQKSNDKISSTVHINTNNQSNNNNERVNNQQSSQQIFNSSHRNGSRPVSQQIIRDINTQESNIYQLNKWQDQKEQLFTNNISNNARSVSDRNQQQTIQIILQKESISKLRTVSSMSRVKRSPMKHQEQKLVAQSNISRLPTSMDLTQTKDSVAPKSIQNQKQFHYQSQSEQTLKKRQKWIPLDQQVEEMHFENQREGELFFKKKETGFNLNFLGRQLTLNNKTCLENLLLRRQEVPSKYDPLVYAKFKEYLKNNRLQALMSTSSQQQSSAGLDQQGQLEEPQDRQEMKEVTNQDMKQHYSSSSRKLNYSRKIKPSKDISNTSIDMISNQKYQDGKQIYRVEELMAVEEESQYQTAAQIQGQKQWRYNMNVESKHIAEYASNSKQDGMKNNSGIEGEDQKMLQSQYINNNNTQNPLEIDYSKSLARMGCCEQIKQQPTSQAYLFKKFVKSENNISNNHNNNNNTQINQISGGIASDLSTNSSIGLVSPLYLKKSKFKTLEGLQGLKTENRSDLYYNRADEDSYRSESMKQVSSDVLRQQLPTRPATQQKQNQNNASNFQTQNLLMILNSSSLKSQNTTEIAGCFWKIQSSLLQLFTSSFTYQMILQETDLKPSQLVKRLLLFLSHSLGQGVEISGESQSGAQSFVNKAKLNPKADLPFTNIGAAIEISLFSDLRLKDTSQQLLISAIKNCISIETSSEWAHKNQQNVQSFIEIVQSRMSRQLKQKNLMTELGGDPNLKRLFCSVFEHMKDRYNIDIFQKMDSTEEQSSCLEQFILHLSQTGKKLIKVPQIPKGVSQNNNITTENTLLFTAYEFLCLKECVKCVTKRQGLSAKLSFRLLERIEGVRNILQRDYQNNIGEQQILNFNAIRAAADRIDQYIVLKHSLSQSDRLVFVENMLEFVFNKISSQSYLTYLKQKFEDHNLIRLFPQMIRFAQSTIFSFEKYSQIQSSLFSHYQHQKLQQQHKQHCFTLQLKYKLHLLSFMISSDYKIPMSSQSQQVKKNINVPGVTKGYLGSSLGKDNEVGFIDNTKVISFDDFDEYPQGLKEQHSEMCQQGLDEFRQIGISKSASSPNYSGLQSNEKLIKQQENQIGNDSASNGDSFRLNTPYFLAVSEDKEEFWEKISIHLSQQLDEKEGKKSQFFNQNSTDNQSLNYSAATHVMNSKPNQQQNEFHERNIQNIQKNHSSQHTCVAANSNLLLIKYLFDYSICAFDIFSVIDIAVIVKQLKINEENIEQSMNCLRDCMISYGLSSSQISSQLEFYKECAKYGIQNGTII